MVRDQNSLGTISIVDEQLMYPLLPLRKFYTEEEMLVSVSMNILRLS